MGRFARLFVTLSPEHRTLDGFVDSLLQIFENSRPGLTADMLAKGGVETFFGELYEKEVRRLREKITQLTHLSKDEQEEFFQRVDERIRKVVLPAYARLASSFTPRERNDFYLTPDAGRRFRTPGGTYGRPKPDEVAGQRAPRERTRALIVEVAGRVTPPAGGCCAHAHDTS